MKKRWVAIALVGAMAGTMLAGCGSSSSGGNSGSASGSSAGAETTKSSGKGSVYYLNFKPEADKAWKSLAKEYQKETGTEVKVVTAASNEYETTLTSEMGKSGAPTLFQVNGVNGLKNWKDYCYDLSGSDVYKQLTNDAYTLKDGDKVDGIAYVTECYGLIVNTKLLKKAGYTTKDIQSFKDLKKVAEDITKRSSKLGFAAFTSAGMDGSSDWRFKTHLANMPIYFEYKDEGVDSSETLKGTYLDNYRNIFDLYINNSTCKGSELSSKTADDSESEFTKGKAVFFQNGSWEYANLKKAGMKDDELAMIPIYIGAGDEAKQGLCSGTENYWCVNSQASKEDIQATLDFMNWCVTSKTGTKAMADDMGFNIPFKKAQKATNLFLKEDKEMTDSGKTPVSWAFSTIPSEEWKNTLGNALTAYAAKPTDANWKEVKSAFVDNWAEEYKISSNE
ncbi:MAG: ABC transporter substrate-binding protein [Lachnospiraceae bacterium]|jgi:raffinose/stachyose/melibiose transport system substrate-binding protein|uniref:ABC transporter substrate-binding protein n=1 Tax=Clostridium sp. (strain SY8519) TaxID=1042156 RepID=UPI0002172067|nr:ABC transporter substrate-binding protein [Clostridium sp. SY8519]MCI1654637.1 ABC transporter substrate-binding protein [Lachnospiraceae bacterium]MCI1657099.1 ABC transporter substrate-binding protein [Lachnospiraceae bacterium]MCI2195477.1 ABC transporter substrate-binding protein [Lachnospiraceae bacterium]BAK47892.1 hypothetical protein CXIVA_19250 [Clostridium sp. SY8519]HAD20428.1 ABC transporter substrate-binding protein [Lachnospiraceae bacterium]